MRCRSQAPAWQVHAAAARRRLRTGPGEGLAAAEGAPSSGRPGRKTIVPALRGPSSRYRRSNRPLAGHREGGSRICGEADRIDGLGRWRGMAPCTWRARKRFRRDPGPSGDSKVAPEPERSPRSPLGRAQGFGARGLMERGPQPGRGGAGCRRRRRDVRELLCGCSAEKRAARSEKRGVARLRPARLREGHPSMRRLGAPPYTAFAQTPRKRTAAGVGVGGWCGDTGGPSGRAGMARQASPSRGSRARRCSVRPEEHPRLRESATTLAQRPLAVCAEPVEVAASRRATGPRCRPRALLLGSPPRALFRFGEERPGTRVSGMGTQTPDRCASRCGGPGSRRSWVQLDLP